MQVRVMIRSTEQVPLPQSETRPSCLGAVTPEICNRYNGDTTFLPGVGGILSPGVRNVYNDIINNHSNNRTDTGYVL